MLPGACTFLVSLINCFVNVVLNLHISCAFNNLDVHLFPWSYWKVRNSHNPLVHSVFSLLCCSLPHKMGKSTGCNSVVPKTQQ